MHEVYGCVDESPPLLRLKNDPDQDQILRLKQGDDYKEYAVDIQDENAEEYLRSLKIAYSQPLPQGCLTKIGEFHVNYTVATPWTSPPYVQVTRRVIIEDIDECSINVQKFQETCPQLIPQCDVQSGATCVNTVGSYTCSCPKYTSGDGFLSGIEFAAGAGPKGFHGGTSCRDTSKPVITLNGPNPKIFRVAECGGISGMIGGKQNNYADLKSQQQRSYAQDIKVRTIYYIISQSLTQQTLLGTDSKHHRGGALRYSLSSQPESKGLCQGCRLDVQGPSRLGGTGHGRRSCTKDAASLGCPL
jgi:hypothetical protein